MAIVVLASTMSFTMNMHYCGGNLVETSFYNSTKGCGMEMEIDTPPQQKCSTLSSDCCQDKELIYPGQDQLQLSFDQGLIVPINLNTSVYYFSFLEFEDIEKEKLLYEEYKPPLVVRRIYKIDETYLI